MSQKNIEQSLTDFVKYFKIKFLCKNVEVIIISKWKAFTIDQFAKILRA